jgi:ribosomal protein uL13
MKENKTENREKIIVDASYNPLGRMASFVAKQALKGKFVVVVNADKAIILGKPKVILQSYTDHLDLGHGVMKGPLHSKLSTSICRQAIRGMIGWKKPSGQQAFKNVRCYDGVPAEYEQLEKITFPKKSLNFMTVGKLSKYMKNRK